jgi:hypothetical protein
MGDGARRGAVLRIFVAFVFFCGNSLRSLGEMTADLRPLTAGHCSLEVEMGRTKRGTIPDDVVPWSVPGL